MNSEDLARVAIAGMNKGTDLGDLAGAIIVVTMLLVCVALPVTLHYRAKARAHAASVADQPGVQALWETARKMESRIGYLETVLDTEVPGWRSRSGMR